jgi:hypothetical protein
MIVGVLCRAQQLHGVKIHALVFASNHYHMLISVESAQQLSHFMKFVNGFIAERANRMLGRSGAFWQRRFSATLVSGDGLTQRWRLRYLLAHGVKERLVARAVDWPGVSTLRWLLKGEPLRGKWTDYTKASRAGRAARKKMADFETDYELRLDPLPTWRHTPERTWRGYVEELLGLIHAEHDVDRAERGGEVLGVERVLATDPFTRIARTPRRPAPRVFALEPATSKELLALLVARAEAWREAAGEALLRLVDQGALRERALPAWLWRGLVVPELGAA